MGQIETRADGTLSRRAVVAELLADRGDLLLVTGLGSPSYDAASVSDEAANYCLWGAMGSAASMGLGLALAQPDRPVLVLTGDGELLMGLGVLATAGAKKPGNLTIGVLDNGRYGETGMQLTHTALGVSLAGVAMNCNFDQSDVIEDMEGVQQFRPQLQSTTSGLRFAQILIKPESSERIMPPRDGVFQKNRFRALLGLPTI